MVTVFVWPHTPSIPEISHESTIAGYSVLPGTVNDLDVALVTDMSPAGARRFKEVWLAKARAP